MTNNYLLTRVTAPASEPVTLTEAKLYLRVDSTIEDSLITDLIVAARMSAESYLRKSLISQTWKIIYNDIVDAEVELLMLPVVSVASVVVVSRDASTQTISPVSYYLNATKNKLIFDNPPTGFAIEITYNTGYGTASQVPAPIKYGILAHIAQMYDERGNYDIPQNAIALYSPFREVWL